MESSTTATQNINKRVFAFLIDTGVLLILSTALDFVLPSQAVAIINFCIYLFRDALFLEGSLGKKLSKLKIQSPSPNPSIVERLKFSFLRNIPLQIGGMLLFTYGQFGGSDQIVDRVLGSLVFVFTAIEYLMMKFNHGKRFGDRLAHTLVIDERPSDSSTKYFLYSLLWLVGFIGFILGYVKVHSLLKPKEESMPEINLQDPAESNSADEQK